MWHSTFTGQPKHPQREVSFASQPIIHVGWVLNMIYPPSCFTTQGCKARYPKEFILKQGPSNTGQFALRRGFLVLPVTQHEANWYDDVPLFKTGFMEVPHNER